MPKIITITALFVLSASIALGQQQARPAVFDRDHPLRFDHLCSELGHGYGAYRQAYAFFEKRSPDDRYEALVLANVHVGWIAGPPGGYAHAAGLPERLERERLLAFLEQLSEELRTQLRQGRPPALLQSWAWQVDQCVARMTALRIQPRHALQGLGSALRAAAGPAPFTGERT